jgi:hypothetical protein
MDDMKTAEFETRVCLTSLNLTDDVLYTKKNGYKVKGKNASKVVHHNRIYVTLISFSLYPSLWLWSKSTAEARERSGSNSLTKRLGTMNTIFKSV